MTIWKFNLQYICYFYLNPLSEKCSNIWSLKLIGHLSKIEVQYYTQIVYVVLYWFLCSIDSGEILEPIIQFHASLILLSEIHLRLITISSPPTTEAASIFKKIVRKEEKKKEWNGILSGESRLKSREVEAMLYGPHFLFKKLGRYKKCVLK